MNAELMHLKDRRKDLTKELDLLSEREEVLRAKTHVLEKLLRTQGIGTPKQAVKGQKWLETAEGMAEGRNWTENANLRTQLVMPDPRGSQLLPASGSKLFRVRLKKNAIFSWRYTKLP